MERERDGWTWLEAAAVQVAAGFVGSTGDIDSTPWPLLPEKADRPMFW